MRERGCFQACYIGFNAFWGYSSNDIVSHEELKKVLIWRSFIANLVGGSREDVE